MDMNQNTTAFTDARDGETYRMVKFGTITLPHVRFVA